MPGFNIFLLLLAHRQINVHRLALQRVELLNDNDRVERDNKELQITNLQLEQEARVAKAAKSDEWQVTNLKVALRQQAAQHETKMASIKRRTKALLTAILPGGHGKEGVGLLDAPGSPTADGEEQLEDLWDAPLTLTAASAPDVHARVRDIIGCLYDDAITEEAALDQMLSLTQKLTARAESAAATSRGCSPLPVPRLAADDVASAGGKVDAGTDAQTARPRLVADVATETPAEMSYVGTPRGASAAPSQGPASPRRLTGSAVPMLDLAALVAQAMEEAPLSGRSTASTSVSASGGPSFSSISQFVLAQPEKLQRLILRHAAATNAKSAQVGFGQARAAQSPFGAGLLPSAAAASAAGANDLYGVSGSTSLMDPMAQFSSVGNQSARPSLTTRLLGLGSSNVANRAPSAAAPQGAAGAGNHSVAGAISGVTMSPAKAAKRSGPATVPKFAKLDGPAQAAPPSHPTGPVLSVPGIKLLPGKDNYSSNIDNGSGGTSFKLGVGMFAGGTADLDSDFKELSLGGSSSSALGFLKPGSGGGRP
ncbi:hypothetical protein PLESTB_001143200 [Pleodorina starrii]|uniref:Uncharacterized protein n=1 Tax=Pleodorina starrii TaxID=330485 RepID=A0A9W6BR04_9CHLO|nr:hypothetical protein PLESTB_001143200 [Pleodorina starrii]GLC66919.1 hypothetical protein PLESTF_000490400 [Pleodorina starrii]